MKEKRLWFVVLVSLLIISCGKEQSSVDEAVEVEREKIWDWGKYVKAGELVLQSLMVDIQPKKSLEIKSEAGGILTIELEGQVHLVGKDTAFARMDIDSLSEQGERLAILEEKRLLEEMRTEKLDLPEQRRQAKEELKEARRKVRLMAMIAENPAMQEMSAELFGSDIGSVTDESLLEAKEELSLAEQKMAWADEYDEKLRKGQVRIEEMDFAKNERSYQQAKDRSVYHTAFAGELRYEFDYVDGQSEYTVTPRELIATLNDYTEIHGVLKVQNTSWINLSPQRLYIQLRDKQRTMMTFQEDRVERDKQTRREERVYVFSVSAEMAPSLKRLTGTEMRGEVVYKLPEHCYIVPKYDVSLYALGKSDTLDWGSMVDELWPGAEILAEGIGNLAIRYQGK